jgi:hypothetical protein
MRNRKEAGRGTIYAMAGIYICITAYNMYVNKAASTGNEGILVFICSILFAIAGAGLVVVGGYMIYKGSKKNGSSLNDNDSEKKSM